MDTSTIHTLLNCLKKFYIKTDWAWRFKITNCYDIAYYDIVMEMYIRYLLTIVSDCIQTEATA